MEGQNFSEGIEIVKIALCLSGQPRGLEKAYEYVKRNLLDVNEHVDVFAHSSIMPSQYHPTLADELYGINKRMCDLYWPKIRSNDMPEKLKTLATGTAPFNGYPAIAAISSFYSIYRANRMKQHHENSMNFKYDLVIRSRFDFAINKSLAFSSPSQVAKNSIVVPWEPHLNSTNTPMRDKCNDQFAMGTSELMDRYCNTYIHLEEFKQQGIPFLGEDLLQANFHKEGLAGHLIYYQMDPPFEPDGKLNGTKHSLVRDDVEFWKSLYQ